MSTQQPQRFHLDSSCLAAHVLAAEGVLFGFDRDDGMPPGSAVAARFYLADAVGAIRGPEGAKVIVYPLSDRVLILVERESPEPAPQVDRPCPRVASCSFHADEIAPPGDASFEACLDGLGELLERANALLSDLDAIRAADADAAAA